MALLKTFFIEKDCVLEVIYCFAPILPTKALQYIWKQMKAFTSDSTSKAILFTEDEFRIKAKAYYDYLMSDENNYNENDEALGNCGMNFLSFTQNYANYDNADI